jgi:hypothetical protein
VALTFVSASSTYVSFPASAFLNNVPGACICGWVKHFTSPAGSFDRLLSIGTSDVADNSRTSIGIRADDTLYVAARTQVADPGAVVGSTGVVPLNTLTFVAANFSFAGVAQVSFYVNGAFVDTIAGDWTVGNMINADSLASAIGASSAGLRFYMDGTLDDLRLYNRMLSANELQIIFACKGSDAIYYGLRARYNMEEKQSGFTTVGGELLRDYSGNFSGTITANCVYADSILKKRRQHQ